MKNPDRVMILSMKAGEGHIRAAEAIQGALADEQRACEVFHVDALQHTSMLFRASFSSLHSILVSRIPSVWRMIYERTEKQDLQSAFKRAAMFFQGFHTRGIRHTVLKHQPDCVICTHFTPAGAVAALKRNGEYHGLLGVVMTDYDTHPMWIHAGVDCYFVATEDMAEVLRQKGIADSQIHVTGIPVLPVFGEEYPEKRVMRRYLGLSETMPTVLISGGGGGLGGIDHTAVALAKEFPEVQFLAVAGNNRFAHVAMCAAHEAGAANLIPFGFVRNMHELMAASDIAVSRCGGMTSTECLAMGLPMIVSNPIPGQEERNLHFLLEHGVALHAQSLHHLIHKLRRLIKEPKLAEGMRVAARAVARPGAAVAIAGAALEKMKRSKQAMPIRLTTVQHHAPTASIKEPDVAAALYSRTR